MARAIEFTAETRSTTTELALAICVGAVTELTASIWSDSALIAGAASAMIAGFTIWGAIDWTCGLKGRGRRSARAFGAAAGFGAGSSFSSWTGISSSVSSGFSAAIRIRKPRAPKWSAAAKEPVTQRRRLPSGSGVVKPG